MSKTITLAVLLIALMLALSACNLPNQTEETDADTILTAAASTVQAQLTADAAANPSATPAPTNTPAPSATSGPTNTPAPTNTTAVQQPQSTCDLAEFISDVTIPDNTKLTPAANFSKTWRLKNIGTCTWSTSYQIVFHSGTAMSGPAAQNLSKAVAPGESIDISVDLTAPDTAGSYQGFWMLRNASGTKFGLAGNAAFWVLIDVNTGATATAGPSPTPGPSPTATSGSTTPGTYSAASSIGVAQTFSVDLDGGNISPAGGGYDFQFQAVDDDNKFITPQNGATFLLWGFGKPSYNDCKNASLGGGTIKVSNSLVGQYVCYKTNEGRFGIMGVATLTPDDKTVSQTMQFSFTTYEK